MLVDSNILVYAVNRSSPKHKASQVFLQNNIGRLEVAHQNVLESLRVLTHPKFPAPMSIPDALDAVESILKACRLIYPVAETYYVALLLIKESKLVSDQIFDAYLVATALSHGIPAIATDNTQDFRKFKQITVVNPFP